MGWGGGCLRKNTFIGQNEIKNLSYTCRCAKPEPVQALVRKGTIYRKINISFLYNGVV